MNTTIMLRIYHNWYYSTVGSIYLTCTEDGWFPPKPRFQSCQKGKITLILYYIASYFTTCIKHLMKIFFQIIEQQWQDFTDGRWLVCCCLSKMIM